MGEPTNEKNNIEILENPHNFQAPEIKFDKMPKTTLEKIYKCIDFGGESGKRMAKILLDNDLTCNLNEIPSGIFTYPLHYAIVMREEDIAMLLIDRGSDINSLDEHKFSPLNYAVSKFNYTIVLSSSTKYNKELPKLVIKLIVEGADLTYVSPVTKLLPHSEANKSGYFFSGKRIIDQINAMLKKNTPISNKDTLIKCLEDEVKHGEMLDSLVQATMRRDQEFVIERIDKLIKKGYTDLVHTCDEHGQTLLHYAVVCNKKDLVKKLIYLQVDPSRRNKKGFTAFELITLLDEKNRDEMLSIFMNCLNEFYSDKEKVIKKEICNNNKSESELSDGSESPKTDSEIIDDFLEYEKVENEKKVTKSSKKKNAKLKKEKERKDIKKEKDKAYNELILMRCEDIRLIQKRREEKWGIFCNKLVDICDFSSFRNIFVAFRNYCIEIKQKRYEEEKQKNILRKQNIKKIKKGFKKLINVQTSVTFNELKVKMLFKRKCLNDTLFFFDFENNYYPNLSEWDSFRDFV